MRIANVLAGLSIVVADDLRQALGRRIPEITARYRDPFVRGAVTNGVREGQAARIFDLIARFARYGFNKGHAAAYGIISYWTAYLKAEYADEYMTAIELPDGSVIDDCLIVGAGKSGGRPSHLQRGGEDNGTRKTIRQGTSFP